VKAEEIEKVEKIGYCAKGDLYHILTKGGYSVIALNAGHGNYIPVAKAGHPAIARHIAEKLDKTVKWQGGLFKSQNYVDKMYAVVDKESIPKTHLIVAEHAAMVVGKMATQEMATVEDRLEHKMQMMNHVWTSLKHFKMAGLDSNEAHIRYNEFRKHSDALPELDYPIDPEKLEKSWKEQNPNKE
jgi:hypothetical protein